MDAMERQVVYMQVIIIAYVILVLCQCLFGCCSEENNNKEECKCKEVNKKRRKK